MLIISKRAFRFVLRNDKKEVTQSVEVRPNIITTIPDWVKNDPLFKLADSDGLITYVEKPAPSVFVDNAPPETPQGEDSQGDEIAEITGATETTENPIKADGVTVLNGFTESTETPQELKTTNNRNNRNRQGS